VFDLLREGSKDLRDRPLVERRAALERLLGPTTTPMIRISRQVRGDGRALLQQAREHGWEGLIAKHAASPYKAGKRTPAWRKIKVAQEEEFVVGGWTDPRQTRSHFGALLLGVYDGASSLGTRTQRQSRGTTNPSEKLVYVGHTGTGFNEKELSRVMTLL